MSSIDKLFGIHATALDLRGRRSEVIANNIANADTPNFKARDFNFEEVLGDAKRASPAGAARRLNATHGKHIGASHDDVMAASLAFRVATQASLDGNTVDAQVEQTAYSENSVKYLSSLEFLSKRIAGVVRVLKEE